MNQHTLILTSGETLTYQLEHRQRRTVGLKITDQGLVVHAPKRIAQHYLESLILQKEPWIQKKIISQKNRLQPIFHWQNDEVLLYLGNSITLNISQNPRNKKVELQSGALTVALPNPADSAIISRKVKDWYKKQALLDFARRLEIFAAKLNVNTPALLLSNAKTRWGSCNSRKEIRLNWRLLQAPPHIINYVVCHELAHLKEMNHSARFWKIVEDLMPEYKNAEKELKLLSAKLHQI